MPLGTFGRIYVVFDTATARSANRSIAHEQAGEADARARTVAQVEHYPLEALHSQGLDDVRNFFVSVFAETRQPQARNFPVRIEPIVPLVIRFPTNPKDRFLFCGSATRPEFQEIGPRAS